MTYTPTLKFVVDTGDGGSGIYVAAGWWSGADGTSHPILEPRTIQQVLPNTRTSD